MNIKRDNWRNRDAKNEELKVNHTCDLDEAVSRAAAGNIHYDKTRIFTSAEYTHNKIPLDYPIFKIEEKAMF